MTARRFVAATALVGVLLPVACTQLPLQGAARSLGGLSALAALDQLILMVWPSAFMLMASTDAAIAVSDPLMLLSTGINGALYAVLGGLLWWGFHRNRIGWILAGLMVAAVWWQALSL